MDWSMWVSKNPFQVLDGKSEQPRYQHSPHPEDMGPLALEEVRVRKDLLEKRW
jgi:hypothetical protein